MRALIIILYLFTCVIIGATADALFDEGIKVWAHAVDALETGLIISGAFLFKLQRRDWLAFIIAYICWRIVGFDYTYNLVRDLPLSYIGGTGWWDMLLAQWIPGGVLFGRFIFLLAAVAIPFKHLKYL